MLYIPCPFKRCFVCHEEYLPTTYHFYRDKSKQDGLSPYCKTCHSKKARVIRLDNPEREKARSKRYRETHADELRIRKRIYAQNHPEQHRAANKRRYWADPDKSRAYQREWANKKNRANPELANERAKKWRKANPQRKSEIERRWRNANPDKMYDKAVRRRAREYSAEGVYTKQDVLLQRKRQHDKCYWCGKRLGETHHADHIIPLFRGGSNWPSNIVVTCSFCNLSKGDKLPHEWDGSGGRLL